MSDRCKSLLAAPQVSVWNQEYAECIHAKNHQGDHEGYAGIWGRTSWKTRDVVIYHAPQPPMIRQVQTRKPWPDILAILGIVWLPVSALVYWLIR